MAARAAGTPRLTLPAALVPLVLASASPRRAELLAAAGLTCERQPADLEESALPGEAPSATALRLAEDKARAVAATRAPPATGRWPPAGAPARAGARPAACVLAADTLIELDGAALGKPADEADARAMLSRLSGRRHRVTSAVALLHVPSGRLRSGTADAVVAFDRLDAATLDGYLRSREWEGKAGAYAIQGRAAAFARLVAGSLDTVVGLPLGLLAVLLRQLDEETR